MEDKFDGANRRNLRHFIVAGEKGEVTIPVNVSPERADTIVSVGDELSEAAQDRYYYLARDKTASSSIQEQPDDRKELVRIQTCAIFHKFAAGRGVPHSFVGFIRQWPALPQVVVSLPFVLLITGEPLTNMLLKGILVGLCPSGR